MEGKREREMEFLVPGFGLVQMWVEGAQVLEVSSTAPQDILTGIWIKSRVAMTGTRTLIWDVAFPSCCLTCWKMASALPQNTVKS